MWPFKKKEVVITEGHAEIEIKAKIERLGQKFILGSVFDYMDVKCKVTRIKHREHAELHVDYVDKNGIIRQAVFDYDEAMRICL